MINERTIEIDEMTRRDNRVEYLALLDEKTYNMQKMLKEHEIFRKR